jgi:hypothetical protein
MRLSIRLSVAVALALEFAFPVAVPAQDSGQPASIDIGVHDIGGVVRDANGPEAGVWVIAETRDLGTRFAKIVVTDDAGRFVIPDLPAAHYQVWVRGYGLVDSPKVGAERGQRLNLEAVIAPDRAAAAQYYPAIYWFSLLRAPGPDKFPGTGPNGNGMPREFKTRDQWLDVIKTNGCGNCHQIGNYATRTMPPAFDHFQPSMAAWARRLQSGPGGTTMVRTMGRLLTADGGHLAALADWTDRIKAGELPKAAPPRPAGIERNIVVTVRDWLDPKHYLHDLAATDKRAPTVNANGPLYGATELSSNTMPVLDPSPQRQENRSGAGPRAGGHTEFGAGQPGVCVLALLRARAGVGQPGQRPFAGDGPRGAYLLHRSSAAAGADPRLLRQGLPAAFGAALSAHDEARGLQSEFPAGDRLRSALGQVHVHRHLLRHPASELCPG